MNNTGGLAPFSTDIADRTRSAVYAYAVVDSAGRRRNIVEKPSIRAWREQQLDLDRVTGSLLTDLLVWQSAAIASASEDRGEAEILVTDHRFALDLVELRHASEHLRREARESMPYGARPLDEARRLVFPNFALDL